jgi:LAO/AO transport system kinase
MKNLDINFLKEGLLNSKKMVLSKAITLIESQKKEDRELANQLINEILPFTGKSVRIGITGSPGVGKSTFINVFCKYLLKHFSKIAILTVDPSSQLSGGSILGDKTRMEDLVGLDTVFIRPSPAGKSLGGVANATYESILLCEAAGYDLIIIETVGVGQSEILVSEMTDLLLYLTIAGSGDSLQGIKRGIMEMVDLVIINKIDLFDELSISKLKEEFNNSFHFFWEKKSKIPVCILTCSSTENIGFLDIIEVLRISIRKITENGFLGENRKAQKVNWLKRSFEKKVLDVVYSNETINQSVLELEKQIFENKITPIQAADFIFDKLKKMLI